MIDIGSNTVLLTCGHLENSKTLKVDLEEHDVARLAQGLRDNQPLHPAAKERVKKVLRDFRAQAEKRGIRHLLAAGTAAFRRASDGTAFAREIREELGIEVRILSGKEEAHFSYLSVLKDFGEKYHSLGMIDIGGGSTELVFGDEANAISLPMGTVRLLEKYVTHQPIPDPVWEKIRRSIHETLGGSLAAEIKIPPVWVAVAATPAALAMLIQGLEVYQPRRIHGFPLKRQELFKVVEILRKSSLDQRLAMKGMHPKRAELLPIGGIILLEVMEFLKINEVIASDHGLRYGLLYQELKKDFSGSA